MEVHGVAYHSPYNPSREARQFYSRHNIEAADFLLHFGWGLGYGGEILRARAKRSARIIVFEPDEDLFHMSRREPSNKQVFADPRFQFVVGRDVGRD